MRLVLALMAVLASVVGAQSQQQTLVIAATTSIMDSGLFHHLGPKFTERTGIAVRLVSRASTEALDTAARGPIDLVIVNNPEALNHFVDGGNGVGRRKLMFNNFVIAGPTSDPANVRASKDTAAALRTIAFLRAPFLSRGDGSGTHAAEQRLWSAAAVNPKARSGEWYRESGLGMGLTLTLASRLNAYVLIDRATWLAGTDRSNLEILVQDDPSLFNQYEVALVNPARHSTLNAVAASSFLDWVVSDEGQDVIAAYRVGGEQAFFPNARAQH
jgi:tungstate transport system substrate-binding protein